MTKTERKKVLILSLSPSLFKETKVEITFMHQIALLTLFNVEWNENSKPGNFSLSSVLRKSPEEELFLFSLIMSYVTYLEVNGINSPACWWTCSGGKLLSGMDESVGT